MRLKKKLAFSLQSMAEIGSTARRVSSLEDMIQTKFFIVRQVAGTYRETAADEHTQVRAGTSSASACRYRAEIQFRQRSSQEASTRETSVSDAPAKTALQSSYRFWRAMAPARNLLS